MNTVAQFIGYAYLVACLLSQFGLLDVFVCIGKPGSCLVVPASPAKTIGTPREKSA
ncbi:hypothetical protein [Rhodoferax sp. BLA1]|uniref:hypothetical protein n=1 Tax=Rhodoferax sp. BLA1 TaxID=2576062 RepID=UPI0015D124F4|nr:hypothetical protein [Rhodoferax sp. BLA1]